MRERLAGWASGRADVILLAVVVFFLPLFFWPGTVEYNYARCVFAIVAVSVVTIVQAALLLRRAARQSQDHVVVPWIVWPLVALVVASLGSLLRATDPRSGAASLVVFLSFSQFGLLVVNAAREKRDATLLLAALFSSSCLVAVHAILQYAGILPGTGHPGPSDMISTLGNPDAVAGLVTCALLPGILLVDHARSWLLKAVVALGDGLLFVTILLTQQMGVLFGLGIGLAGILVGWILFRPRRERKRQGAFSLGLLAVIGAVLLSALGLRTVPGAISAGSLPSSIWKTNSGEARALFWNVSLTMWKDNPVLGVGLANYKTVYPNYEADVLAQAGTSAPSGYIPKAAQAHNDYLQAAAELGTPGALAVVGLLVVIAVSLWKRLRADASWNRFDLLVLSGGVAVFLAHAFVGFPVHLAAPALAALVCLALALSPAYGADALHRVRVRRSGAVSFLVVALIAGGAASVLAGRDLAANVLQLRGTRLLQMGHPETALVTLEQSIALDANPRMSYFYLASAQYRVGRYRDALDSLSRCLERFPDENAYVLYADLAAGLGELDRGLAALDFVLSTSPSPETANKARYVRALILRQKGDVAAAEAALRDLVAAAPSYEPGYIALGEIFASRGRTDEARSLFERASALVDAELPAARQAVSGKSPMTYDQYARAEDRLVELTREKDTIERDLAALRSQTP